MERIPNFNKCRAFNKDVGPGKKPKINKVGPTFIPEYRAYENGKKKKMSRTCPRAGGIHQIQDLCRKK